MSRLYVRILTSFYSHRKTVRLMASIGEAAFWVPPRLWAYASENQPDGDFSQYAPEELAMLVAYKGDAQALLQALLQAGFMDADPLRIHNWAEHNGYHAAFAERAKRAAAARWAKSPPVPPLKKEKEKEKVEPSIASSIIVSLPTVNASSIAQASEGDASSIPFASILLIAVGDMYGRKEGQFPSYAEEHAAAVVVRREGWESELQTILCWMETTKPENKKYLPSSVEALLGNWTKHLDRAINNKPPPVKRWGTRGVL